MHTQISSHPHGNIDIGQKRHTEIQSNTFVDIFYCKPVNRKPFQIIFQVKMANPDSRSIFSYSSAILASRDRYSEQTLTSGLRVIPQDSIVLIDRK